MMHYCDDCIHYDVCNKECTKDDAIYYCCNKLSNFDCVKIGHWEHSLKKKGTDRLVCSNCGKPNHVRWKPYCYECGSKNTEIIEL